MNPGNFNLFKIVELWSEINTTMKQQKIVIAICLCFLSGSDLMAQLEFSGISKPASFSIINEGLPINKIPPVEFIRNYVEINIAEWQKKEEFEKSSDYRIRVTEQTRNQKVQIYTDEAVKAYKIEYAKTINWDVLKLSQYDADNETFLIKSDFIGDFAIPVPIAEAQSLKQNWNQVKFSETDFIILNNNLILSKINIFNPVNEKFYQYDSKKSTVP